MAWNEFKANHLKKKILREDLDREFEVDLNSYSDIYQPRKKWTIKAQVAQARRMQPEKALVHSGKVRAAQFNTPSALCCYIFHRIWSWYKLLYYLIDSRKIRPEIQQFAGNRTWYLEKKINFDYLQLTAELILRYWLPQRKLTVLKICRK